MSAAESVALAGKMWLYEDDTRTCLADDPGFNPVDTIEKTNYELLRHGPMRGAKLRHLVDGLGATGWFNDRRMWAEMTRLKTLDEPLLRTPAHFGRTWPP